MGRYPKLAYTLEAMFERLAFETTMKVGCGVAMGLRHRCWRWNASTTESLEISIVMDPCQEALLLQGTRPLWGAAAAAAL